MQEMSEYHFQISTLRTQISAGHSIQINAYVCRMTVKYAHSLHICSSLLHGILTQ